MTPNENLLAREYPASLRKQWQEYYDRALGGERFQVEIQGPLAEHPYHNEFFFNPIRTTEGRITGVTVFGYDIGERVRAQTAVAQNQARMAHLARLNTMGQMSAGLAHELNQPLTAIVNFVHYCQSVVRAGKEWKVTLPEALEAIDREAKRAGEIIWRLRTFIRKQEPQRTAVSANDLVADCLGLVGPTLKQNGVQTVLHLEPHLPLAMIDAVQVEQVLVNLVQNAIEAMVGIPLPERILRIETETADAGRIICIRVVDQGVGILPEDLENVFEEFHTTKPEGLGLGLAISKGIVESHGGRITARRNADRGMTFECTLPVQAS